MPLWTTRRRPEPANTRGREPGDDIIRVEAVLLSMDEGWLGGGVSPPGGNNDSVRSRSYAAEHADPLLLERMDVVFWGGPVNRFDSTREIRATGDALYGTSKKAPKFQISSEDSLFCRPQHSIPAHRCPKFSAFEAVMDELWYGDDGIGAQHASFAVGDLQQSPYATTGSGDWECRDADSGSELRCADASAGRVIEMFEEMWHGAAPSDDAIDVHQGMWQAAVRPNAAFRRQWSTRVGVIGRLDMWWGGGVESVESRKTPVVETRAQGSGSCNALDLIVAMDHRWERV